MELNATIKTYTVVSASDLDAFIQYHTGRREYECVAGQEWGNDSWHSYHVDGKSLDFARRDFEKFKAGEHDGNWLLQYILDGLCAEGKLAAGDYLVRV